MGFWWSPSLLRYLCPLSVPWGGDMWGMFRKPLKRAIWNTLGLHAELTTCSRFSSVSDGSVFLTASFCQQAATMSAYKFTPYLLLPLMHHRNLWCAKERALGV